jgi:hypothetical protein
MVAPKGGAPLRLGSPGDGGGGSLKATAEDAAIASITIIRATTVDNKSMRRIMRYPLSLEGGARQPPVLRNRITMMKYKGWRNFRECLTGELRL